MPVPSLSPPPPTVELVFNTPPGNDTSPLNSLMAGQCGPKEEVEEEEEQIIGEAFILLLSIAPAIMQFSKAGRKGHPH
jgi:hypothetical protein